MTERDRLFDLIANMPPEVCTAVETTDYLLDNGVILPPCKVGDVVFMLGQDEILEMKVFQKTTGINGSYYDSRNTAYNDFEDIFVDVDVGQTVFLTREEAEEALEKRKGQKI